MMSEAEPKRERDPLRRPEVRWGVGCLLGAAAMIGLLILTFLVAFALGPPTWLQVLMGIGLVAAGGALTVIVALALGRSSRPEDPGVRPVSDEEEPST